MSFISWLRGWQLLSQQAFGKQGGAQTSRTNRRRARLALEALEDRSLPSAGALDPTFGTGGLVTTNLGPWRSPTSDVAAQFASGTGIVQGPHSVAVQSDGKIIVAGADIQGLYRFLIPHAAWAPAA